MCKKRTIVFLLAALLAIGSPAWAAGPPSPSLFSSPIALSLLGVMVFFLIIIAILAWAILRAADLRMKLKKAKEKAGSLTASLLLPLLLLAGSPLFAQGTPAPVNPGPKMIGELTSGTFYLMFSIICLEMLVILVMVINLRHIVKSRKQFAKAEGISEAQVEAIRKSRPTWWQRFNRLRPVGQEQDLDLGHDYDGIRELDNRLPPWWLYGFYITIIFAGIYLWRFHISHTGPSSSQEYVRSVARAEERINEYLKSKGEAIDENTVKLLTSAADLDAGRSIFLKSCAACHKETGAGDVGPNLTDDFWLHGNDIKNVFKTIRYGFNAMPQWQMAYSNKQIAQVASYVKSLHGTNPPNPKAPQGVEMKEVKNGAAIPDSLKLSAENKTVSK